MERLSNSAPMTSAWRASPVLMNCSATIIPKSAPAQAAETSKAQAREAPNAAWTRAAVDGVGESGVTVPTMMRSISSAAIPAERSAWRAAFVAI